MQVVNEQEMEQERSVLMTGSCREGVGLNTGSGGGVC